MKKRILHICSVILWACLSQSCVQALNENLTSLPDSNLVMVEAGINQIIHHKAYTLSYNEEHEQADWVAYRLTRDMVNGKTARTNDFREDAAVTTGSAMLEDYYRSGYTRGHLAPAGDMKWDAEAMSESFFMSNMSPQIACFNDGIWNTLENRVRQWARYYQEVYVVTGPIFEEGMKKIGRNGVSVPNKYYKVIYVPDREMMIGFVVEQETGSVPVQSLAVTVDEVEALTGLNFFPTLGEEMESEININNWKW